jgi:CheY-like chemotaxis protein
VNFLSNAVKFTREGGVTVRLLHGINYPVAISVTDTGIGIPVEKRELIFEAFKQADGSTSRRFGGTGLGLTISRELATLIGGRIEVESEVGKGSTFTLLLPAEIPLQVAARDATGAAASKGDRQEQHLPVADYRGARVLLVDDDMRNLLALTPLLEQWKLDVMAAGDGIEALETLQAAGAFDLVILDIMMPDMDGYELTRRLRKDPRFAALPVITLTARAGREEQQASLEAGADAFLSKPVDPAELKEILDKFLAGRGNPDAQQPVDV